MSTQSLNGGIKKVAVANNSITTNQNQKEKTIDLAKIMVSQFESTKQTEKPKQITLKQFCDDIKSSQFNKKLISDLHRSDDKTAKSKLKRENILAITLSNHGKDRKAGSTPDSYTNLIQIDMDNVKSILIEHAELGKRHQGRMLAGEKLGRNISNIGLSINGV